MSTFDSASHPRNHPTGAGRFSDHLRDDAAVTLNTLDTDREEFEANILRAKEAAAAYYNTDVETMSDAEYDTLIDGITAYENDHPDVDTAGLLTQVAAGTAKPGDVIHDTPMLSLDKANTKAEIQAFLDKAKAAGSAVTVEPKLDGMAINITYSDGILTRIGTRGDGTSGEDITDRVKALNVNGIPAAMPQPGHVNVRGELLMTASDFELSNKNRQASGKTAFANPRNATAGTVRATNLGYTVALTFVTYDVVDGDGTKLDDSGAGLILAREIETGADTDASILEQIDTFGIHRKDGDFPYPTDGIVLKMSDPDVRDELGHTSRAPRWAVAYKYTAETATTKLLAIEVGIGRTGNISYTAVLEPVEVDGSVVARATLHNGKFIEDNDLRIGDVVSVYKANDIIPRVVESFPEFRDENSEPYIPSHYSPVSGSLLDMSGVIWRSTDPEDALGSLFAYSSSRDALDIEGLGDEVADALALSGTVNDLGDLFNLTEQELAKLTLSEGRQFGSKNAAKVYAEIQKAKNQPLNRVITALGIRKTGRTFGRRLAAGFGSMDALLAATEADFYRVEGAGDGRAKLFYEGFQRNAPVIAKMRAAGVTMLHAAATAAAGSGAAAVGNALAGMKVVVSGGMTGSLAGTARNEMNELIEAHGGKSSGSVSAGTSLLVTSETGTSKALKAAELGVRVVTPEEFAAMIGR